MVKTVITERNLLLATKRSMKMKIAVRRIDFMLILFFALSEPSDIALRIIINRNRNKD